MRIRSRWPFNVVQGITGVPEAKRLAAYEDVAHGRLALLLLDNAAETSLMRSAQNSMVYAEMYESVAYVLGPAGD